MTKTQAEIKDLDLEELKEIRIKEEESRLRTLNLPDLQKCAQLYPGYVEVKGKEQKETEQDYRDQIIKNMKERLTGSDFKKETLVVLSGPNVFSGPNLLQSNR